MSGCNFHFIFVLCMTTFTIHFTLISGSKINNAHLIKAPKQTSTERPTFETGVGCGNVRMHANHIIQLQSSNFRVANYFNNDACSWTFTASSCDLSIHCPCFDIPSSFGCLEDYLKIGYLKFHDKFCGENPPIGVYRANGDSLIVKFRSDYRESGKGFMCFVRCTKAGSADPVPPASVNVTCPTGTTNPFGIITA